MATVRIANRAEGKVRNKPVNPALLDAVSSAVDRSYGPGYTVVLQSGAQSGDKRTGSHRHDASRGGLAGDFQIIAPDGHQLAGGELAPLADNWIGIDGSMGVNQKPGEAGGNYTHMDLIGGIKPYSVPAGRGEGKVWYYDSGKYRFNEEKRNEHFVQRLGFPSVTAYQAARGLDPDGIMGPITTAAVMRDIGGGELPASQTAAAAPPDAQSAIASLLPPQGGTLAPAVRAGAEAYAPFLPPPSPGQAAISDLISPPSTASSSDVDKLAGVMLAEARGEGREGMAGVGNVVLNRAQAGGNRFPKTIDGVINSEFAKPLGPNDVSPEEWVEARDLATQLKNGAIPDNTGGAVYFANTATSNPNAYAEIANSGPVSATIGNHTFHTDAKIGPVARGTGDLTADQIDELTRTDVAGNYTNPLVAPPLGRRPGPGGALGVDLGQQPAGMPPPPSRPGNFDWLGGGAPPAALVPPPGISPLRPAFGGPGDRRPQPPIPPSRASGLPLPPMRPGNFDYMGGGAPDAAGLPLPPSRPMGMPPSATQSPVGAFSPPGTPSDLVPFLPPPAATAAAAIAPPLERANRNAGQGGPVIPISPAEMRSSLANANANTEMSLGLGGSGTPETQMSLDRSFPPPRPSFDQLQSESDSRLLASDIARTRGMMERSMQPLPNFDTPPPSGGPDFAVANPSPSPILPPSWSPATSFPGELAMGPAEEAISAPPPTSDPWARAYGYQLAIPANWGDPTEVSLATSFDDAFGVPPIPEVSAGGTVFKSPAETKAIQQAMAPGSGPIDLRPQTPTIDPVVAAAHMPYRPPVPQQPIVKAAAAAAAAPAKTAEERKRGGLPSFLAPFFGGGGVAGFLGGFGAPPSFTAYGPQNEGWMNGRMNTPMGSFRTSGTAPYGKQGGTTNWSSGTGNALGGSNALRWTGSNGQTITAYTDPNTGQTFHSFS